MLAFACPPGHSALFFCVAGRPSVRRATRAREGAENRLWPTVNNADDKSTASKSPAGVYATIARPAFSRSRTFTIRTARAATRYRGVLLFILYYCILFFYRSSRAHLYTNVRAHIITHNIRLNLGPGRAIVSCVLYYTNTMRPGTGSGTYDTGTHAHARTSHAYARSRRPRVYA